ncbi:unnamed protein product [Closterium sp. NIES-54]
MMGTKVFKATLDGRVLWDLRGGKDMHRSMWEIPVLPWKEAAARLAAEAVRGGHANHRVEEVVMAVMLQQLFKEERVKGLRIKGEPKEVGSCDTCLTSKFSRFPFHSTVGQSSDPVELVHVDLVGPMKVKGDGLPLRFWPLAIRHATVIKNWVLTHVGGFHWVPMEKWSGKKPLVDMLRVFRCMGLVHVPKEQRDKLQAAAAWAIHLELTEVSHDLGGAEGEAADVEEVMQQGEAPVAERGDTEEEVQQPTPSPTLPPRRTTQGKRDAVRGGAKEGAAKERPKRAAHPRDFLKYERLGVPKALLVHGGGR